MSDQQLSAMINCLMKHGREVKKCGSGFKCLSPFKNEKSPSFHLFEKSGRWYWRDFSADCGGDAIKLLQTLDAASFPDACVRTGQEHILEKGSLSPTPPVRLIKLPDGTRKIVGSQVTPQLKELVPLVQEHFVNDVYYKARSAPNIMLQFIMHHFGEADAAGAADENICMCADPYSTVQDNRGTMWWAYIDTLGRVVRLKRCVYAFEQDPRMLTGWTIKRDRSTTISLACKDHGVPQGSSVQHLYGLPYLRRSEDTVFIVESEKTAELLRIKTCHSSILATGGSGFQAAVLYPVRDKKLVLLPDMDKRQQSFEKVKDLRAYGLDIRVGDWWSDYAERYKIGAHEDIGDLVQMLTKPKCFELWSKLEK
jgi:hypothetical protein